MPVTYSFDERIVVMHMHGTYSVQDLQRGILEALADTACPSSPVLMFDLRESLSLPDRTPDEVRDMARFLGVNGDRFGRRLGMVTSNDISYGLMRLGAATVEAYGVTP